MLLFGWFRFVLQCSTLLFSFKSVRGRSMHANYKWYHRPLHVYDFSNQFNFNSNFNFHWNLSDSNFPQISWSLQSILTDPNSAMGWTISILPLMSDALPVIFPIPKIHFYVNNLFYLKEFSLASVHSLVVKNISISNYSTVIYNNSV